MATVKRFTTFKDSVLTPISVNVLTAGVLFALALAFKPLVQSLLRTPDIAQYPLVCFAEPYAVGTPGERFVDFYIVNLRDKSYTRADLIGLLTVFNPDPSRPLTPDLDLVMRSDEPGLTSAAQLDSAFNAHKGRLLVNRRADGRGVSVRVDAIEPRAFMKVTIRYSGIRDLGLPVDRTAKILVPFEFDDLQDRCFRT